MRAVGRDAAVCETSPLLRQIAWSFRTPASTDPRLLMLTFYGDTSGQEGDERRLVVTGGYLGHEKQWERWESEWSRTLREFGVSTFHATDFNTSHGEFKGWDAPKKIAFSRLITAITEARLEHGYAYGVRCDDEYQAAMAPVLQEFENLHDKFTAKMFSIIVLLAKVAIHPRPAGEKIAVVFEQEAGTGEAIEWLNYRRSKREVWLVSAFTGFATMSKKEGVWLQSADLLAHEAWRAGCEYLDPVGRPERKSLARLGMRDRLHVGTAKPDGLRIGAAKLAEFLKDAPGGWHSRSVYPLEHRLPPEAFR